MTRRLNETRPEDHGETSTIEVRVYRDGRLLERELCESEVEAALAFHAWTEIEGVECEVDDLTTRHHPGDVLEEPEPTGLDPDDYPAGAEPEGPAERWPREDEANP